MRRWDIEKPRDWSAFLNWELAYWKEQGKEELYHAKTTLVSADEYHQQTLLLFHEKDILRRLVSLRKGGRRIGFARYVIYPYQHLKAVLEEFYLLPAERGLGQGAYFLQAIEADMLSYNARYVDVSPSDRSRSFFTRANYQRTNDPAPDSGFYYRKFLLRPFPYTKMLVLGSPGAGKSFLSSQLAARFGYPIVHMDMLYWRENWQHLTDMELRSELAKVMAGESWIIDGNYATTLEYRIQNANVIFFLDYPPEICLEGERLRRGKPREDFPGFLKEGEDPEFLRFIARFPQENRPLILGMADKYLHTPFIRFSSREECNQFLSLYPPLKK